MIIARPARHLPGNPAVPVPHGTGTALRVHRPAAAPGSAGTFRTGTAASRTASAHRCDRHASRPAASVVRAS
ncbi:hypothetical protein CK936_15880 [Streptomyces albireticuli]|uniref:Uncharacterized protein n=1 Tax=Streptomyces albireticuli TaxID=1940 RepID=A0A2A2D8Z1_9ACTN|nr:hypothetical protein CK936_15880 [Streptomyces albireticuli]